MDVGIKVIAENMQTQRERHTNSCFFTMVAVDENRNPVAVKPLELRNQLDKRRFEEAKIRRAMRLRMIEEQAVNRVKLKQDFQT